MAKASEVERRLKYLTDKLEQSRGAKLLFTDLKEQLAEDLDQTIGVDTISRNLQQIKAEGIRGHNLTVGRDYVTCKRRNPTTLETRAPKRAETKHRLGVALWQFLFDIDLGQGIELSKPPLIKAPSKLGRKVATLRKRMTPSVLIDAGSTTAAAARALLHAGQMPIEINPDAPEGPSYVRPSFVTNSITIASVITDSNYSAEIQVRMIGGDLRIDRGSICGALADMCLNAWGARGDLAVIGTTGYRLDFDGTPAFCCDTISEAKLKSALLEAAWLRGIILDSTKLENPEVAKAFAPLSSQLVDLVVTDDGREIGAEKTVTKFCKDADAAGVSVLLLKTEAPSGQGQRRRRPKKSRP